MSSSPRPANPRAANPGPAKALPSELQAQPEGVPFPYGEATLPSGQSQRTGFGSAGESGSGVIARAAAAESEAQARAAGRQQGEVESLAKFEEQLARERSAMAQALAGFARQRAAYYRKIEEEAVQLSLSIARKILHREAQVDPLLLMGIVRVALEQIEGATGVVLAVPPQQGDEWRRFLALRMDPAALPEIVEDPAMAPEQCELRTSMGIARPGVEVQLKEIEQGLMDLLAARPQEKEKP